MAAELGALDLARSTAPPGLVLDPVYGPQVIAGPYYAAARDLGSTPADSPAEILRSPRPMRAASDEVLVRAGALGVSRSPVGTVLAQTPPSLQGAARGTFSVLGGCLRLSPTGPGSRFDLGLPPSGIELRPIARRGVAGAMTVVRVERFDSGYENRPIAALRGTSPLLVRANRDSDARPWQMRISPGSPLEACAVR